MLREELWPQGIWVRPGGRCSGVRPVKRRRPQPPKHLSTPAPQHPSTPAPSPGSPLPLAAAPSARCCRRERRSPRSDGPQLSVSWALSLTRKPLDSLSLTPRHTLCIFPSLFALGIKKNEGVIISNKKKDSFEQQ